MPKVSTVNANGVEKQKGNIIFKEKSKEYLKEKSRHVVEDYNVFEILLYNIDWFGSKKNLYGELKEIKFKFPQGIKLSCKVNVEEQDMEKENSSPNLEKTNVLNFIIYDELLKEKNIELNKGDFIVYGKRLYTIYDYTIKDNEGVGMANGEKFITDVYAYEETDERINNTINNEIIKNLNSK